jgi:hypothetical protein
MRKGGTVPLKDWYVDLCSFSVQAKTIKSAKRLAELKLRSHTPVIDSVGYLGDAEDGST